MEKVKALAVVGSQWGDEGKGKITNYLAEHSDVIIRYQGGDNAGHTVKFLDKEFHLKAIPSGIFYEDKINIMGNGMVINPLSLKDEMLNLKKEGYSLNNLYISDRATLDLSYHLKLDGIKEEKLKESKIGTTKRGIGPSYTDKMERSSLRISDFISDDFPLLYKEKLEEKNKLIEFYGGEKIDYESTLKEYLEAKEIIKDHVIESISFIHKLKKENKKILFEGAQGTMLDIDFGTFPYVTSSNTISGGALTGSGIGLGYLNDCIAIVKAYTTRVGEGPFVSEIFDETASKIREIAHEYGVNTHRPRRIGYLDLVQLRYSSRVNGFNYIALTLLDVFSNFDEIKACTSYLLDDKEIDYFPTSLKDLSRCKPIYKTFKSFKGVDISKIRRYEDLPIEAKNYIEFIESYLEVKVALISVGSKKEETIIRYDIF